MFRTVGALHHQESSTVHTAIHAGYADCFLASCQQTCTTYMYTYCCVYSIESWWWTEQLSETCRVLFLKLIWEISTCRWFYYKNQFNSLDIYYHPDWTVPVPITEPTQQHRWQHGQYKYAKTKTLWQEKKTCKRRTRANPLNPEGNVSALI